MERPVPRIAPVHVHHQALADAGELPGHDRAVPAGIGQRMEGRAVGVAPERLHVAVEPDACAREQQPDEQEGPAQPPERESHALQRVHLVVLAQPRDHHVHADEERRREGEAEIVRHEVDEEARDGGERPARPRQQVEQPQQPLHEQRGQEHEQGGEKRPRQEPQQVAADQPARPRRRPRMPPLTSPAPRTARARPDGTTTTSTPSSLERHDPPANKRFPCKVTAANRPKSNLRPYHLTALQTYLPHRSALSDKRRGWGIGCGRGSIPLAAMRAEHPQWRAGGGRLRPPRHRHERIA